MRFLSHEAYTLEIESVQRILGFFVALVVSYDYTKMVYTCKSVHFFFPSFQCSKLCEEATRFRFLKRNLCLTCTLKRNARRAMPVMQILEIFSLARSRTRSALISARRVNFFFNLPSFACILLRPSGNFLFTCQELRPVCAENIVSTPAPRLRRGFTANAGSYYFLVDTKYSPSELAQLTQSP